MHANKQEYTYYSIESYCKANGVDSGTLPYAIRVLLESALRHYDGFKVTEPDLNAICHWDHQAKEHGSFAFTPARILLQDLTGVPLVVDIASLRADAARKGGRADGINPILPVDLVIDHSVQVDYSGSSTSLAQNVALEYERNSERYRFLKWAQKSIKNFRVVPPSSGIVHQVNLEYLASLVMVSQADGSFEIYPDSVYGTDSHTTMVSGMGVLGWGVGGIEAAAAMLNEPTGILIPDVIGIHVTGKLPSGAAPTDIVLTLTSILRRYGVVNRIIEFFGPGVGQLSVPDRAMIANMAPEYGATTAFFPVDQAVLDYLEATGRTAGQVELVENYYRSQGLFRSADETPPLYTDTLALDLGTIQSCLAGPKRPQDMVLLPDVPASFAEALSRPVSERGYGLQAGTLSDRVDVSLNGRSEELGHGFIAIAAITSCTNTSNPYAMISAGLLARKAEAFGLKTRPWVKTSLAPGSRVVTGYLEKAGLMSSLKSFGFHVAGYGCTTCIGNSGPLSHEIERAIKEYKLIAGAVISGNRNFEGRVHPLVQANYLASPALVIAYAIVGTFNIDLSNQPIGVSNTGRQVFLSDIWPSADEVQAVIADTLTSELYSQTYETLLDGDERWRAIPADYSLQYPWDPGSTYIRESPFCSIPSNTATSIKDCRILAIFGDSITTDHISPAGSIPVSSAAGAYLQRLEVSPENFNTYGARRGNHEVMKRGTFANIRIKNLIVSPKEGSLTRLQPGGTEMSIYDAAESYAQIGVPLVIIAGKEYGTGSSRDWAAKGPLLLGVRAVIVESFERIHRSNLVGMGILPLQFKQGMNAASIGLVGDELLDIEGLDRITPEGELSVRISTPDGSSRCISVDVKLGSTAELELWSKGGILSKYAGR